MKRVVCIIAVMVLAVMFIGCASTIQQVVRSNTNYNRVFKACMEATADVSYGISSSDSKVGLIVAEQAQFGNSAKVVKLNIMVSREGKMTEVRVNWVPPPGSVGGSGIVDKYIAALKKRIPDIKVSPSN
jgi:hypothetical protein